MATDWTVSRRTRPGNRRRAGRAGYFIILAQLPVESGKRLTAARTGTPSSINSCSSSAPSRSRHRSNLMYAGTGEAAIRGNTTYGTGVFKSFDGGKTWENVGLKDTRQIGAVISIQENENVVLVGTAVMRSVQIRNVEYFEPPMAGESLDESFVQRRKHRRDRCCFDPHNPNIFLLFAVAGATAAVVFLRAASIDPKTMSDVETSRGQWPPEGILGRIVCPVLIPTAFMQPSRRRKAVFIAL